ncbi:hypothetical protein [Kitasatospora aureofaciens]|uniref:hypothetical protein n=1 Tax=Kitasatospora aureofaciens TaxID=1894 RepID=UPI0033FCF8E0
MTDLLPRLAAAPARTVAVLLSALLLFLVVLASLPAVVLMPTATRGHRRSDSLMAQITTWTTTVLTGLAPREPESSTTPAAD